MSTVNFQVAGVRYRLAAFEKAQVCQGDALSLKPEPTNQYDPNAIQVLKGKFMIGYVPRTHNSLLVEALQAPPKGLTCAITSVWPGGCSARVSWPDEAPPSKPPVKVVTNRGSELRTFIREGE